LCGTLFLWGRLSSLRPAFQPAWAPFTHCPPCNRSPPRPWSSTPALLAMPAALWSPQSCGPRRQSWRRLASDLPPLLQWGSLFCGAGFPACGRLSSRPWPPLPTALLHPIAAPSVEQAARLAMPAVTPAEQHNPELYGSPNAIRPARLRAPPQPAASLPISVSSVFSVVFPPWFPPCPLCGLFFLRALRVVSDVGQAFQPAAGFPAGLGPLYPLPSFTQSPPPVEQAARLAMPAVTPAEPHNPERTGPRTPSSPHDCALHLNPPPLSPSPCPPCPLWFVFSVPSVSCPMWGRLSSLRPAFQPALAPFTHRPFSSPLHARPKFSL
jgi:hypothetical protein